MTIRDIFPHANAKSQNWLLQKSYAEPLGHATPITNLFPTALRDGYISTPTGVNSADITRAIALAALKMSLQPPVVNVKH